MKKFVESTFPSSKSIHSHRIEQTINFYGWQIESLTSQFLAVPRRRPAWPFWESHWLLSSCFAGNWPDVNQRTYSNVLRFWNRFFVPQKRSRLAWQSGMNSKFWILNPRLRWQPAIWNTSGATNPNCLLSRRDGEPAFRLIGEMPDIPSHFVRRRQPLWTLEISFITFHARLLKLFRVARICAFCFLLDCRPFLWVSWVEWNLVKMENGPCKRCPAPSPSPSPSPQH
jgi:hypothetical protein